MNKKYAIQMFSLFFALLLFVSSMIAFMTISFGWFASNTNVSGNGLAIKVNDVNIEVYYSLDDGDTFTLLKTSDSFDLTNLKEPGDNAPILFKIVNKSNVRISIDYFGIDTPTEDDEVSSTIYEKTYLGTQIKVELSEKNNEKDVDNYNSKLAEYNKETDTLSINKITLYDDKDTLDTDEELYLLVNFTFIYEKFSQNEYMEFDGTCSRSFFYEYSIVG